MKKAAKMSEVYLCLVYAEEEDPLHVRTTILHEIRQTTCPLRMSRPNHELLT